MSNQQPQFQEPIQQQQEEQAYELWKPNVAYSPIGMKVEYEGTFYELRHPHTSQMGWEPTQTPALWKVCHNQEGFHRPSQYSTSEQQLHETLQPQPQTQYNQSMGNTTKTFELPYQWVPYTGTMPLNAIGIPNDLGKTFFVARGKHNGGIHPGYADPAKNRCYTSYGGKEVVNEKFEILICDSGRYSWVTCKDQRNLENIKNLVIAGNESNGVPLYSCKILREKIPYLGKTSKIAPCAYYGLDGNENRVNQYEVLTYN